MHLLPTYQYLHSSAFDEFLQLKLCALLWLSGWNTGFMLQQLEKISVIWCCINSWAIVLYEGALIARSEMLAIQQALERYWNMVF